MITFHSKEHEYFNESKEKYISVSGLEKLIEPEKDWKEIANKRAKKLTKAGTPTKGQDLLDLWAKQKELGSGAGTIYHSYEEDEVLKSGGVIKPCKFENGIKYSHNTLKLENNSVYPEIIIYSHNWKIAGQIDKLSVINNKIEILDHKTDKEIKRKAYSSEWIKAEKLLPPVAHLDNCNYNTYSIKMSLYMYLIWEQNKNLKIGDLLLQWIQFERDELGIPIMKDNFPIVKSKEIIKVPYLRKEVKDILEWYKEGKL